MSTLPFAKIKRCTTVIVAVMMFVTIFAVLSMGDRSNVYATGETGQVTASVLNVRSGAGTKYSRIGSLNKGKTFIVTGSAKDSSGVTWYKFNYGSRTGYVSSQYVNIKQPTVTSVSNTKGTVSAGGSTLFVRSGPGTSYSKLGYLASGKTFTIKGKAQDISGVWWYTLDYNGKTGYVSSQYVKTTTTSSGVTTVSNTTGTVSTGSDILYVRSGPGTNYSKLGYLNSGKTFNVKGKAQDSSGVWWYTFDYNGKTGYVSSKYVKTTTSSGTTETPQTSSGTVVNTGSDPLNIRKGPGTNYSVIGSLKLGNTFNIVASAKDSSGTVWYKLTYNGSYGYVSSKYVKVSDQNTGSDPGTTTPPAENKPVTFQMGTVTTSDGLNVRTGAGTSYKRLDTLPKGTSVVVTGSAKDSSGKVWYKYQYSTSQAGYLCSDYLSVKTVTSTSEFEAYLTVQGFPESYKPALRALHANHPQWVFKAAKLGYNWSDALNKESKIGVNLVSSSAPISHRSTEKGSYNSSTKSWTRFDGSWYAASKTVIAYYMDPRNFLTEDGIYQFMKQSYDSGSQNANTVAAVIKGSFMQNKNPGGGYSSYASLIDAAGKNLGVNPNVLAAMIIQEQGWNGSSLVSGTYSGYVGYYNFFNIGAYTADGMNAVQRGLWYAKRQGWNTPYKSIIGGAETYAKYYVKSNQDSYYTKKFNVKNGLGSVATHQYMTYVAAAASEGSIVKRAYSGNDNYPVVFEIPVYNNMPSTACRLP